MHLFIWPDVFDDYNGGDVPGAHNTQETAKKERLTSYFPAPATPLSNPIPRSATGRSLSALQPGDMRCLGDHIEELGSKAQPQAQPEQPRCGKGSQLAVLWAWPQRTERFWGKGESADTGVLTLKETHLEMAKYETAPTPQLFRYRARKPDSSL